MKPRMTDVVLPPTFEQTARPGSGAHKSLPSAKVLIKYFAFLDDLRKSGVTNMYGATPYLQKAFGIKRETATTILLAWMDTFSDEPIANRAAIAAAKGGNQ